MVPTCAVPATAGPARGFGRSSHPGTAIIGGIPMLGYMSVVDVSLR